MLLFYKKTFIIDVSQGPKYASESYDQSSPMSSSIKVDLQEHISLEIMAISRSKRRLSSNLIGKPLY